MQNFSCENEVALSLALKQRLEATRNWLACEQAVRGDLPFLAPLPQRPTELARRLGIGLSFRQLNELVPFNIHPSITPPRSRDLDSR